MKFLSLVACVVAVIGCAHGGSSAQPTIVTPAAPEVVNGVSTYRLSDGEVRIAMLPIVQLPALWIGQQATRALHVRVTFDNSGLQAWTVVPRKQLAHVGEYGPLLPAATNGVPLVIAPGRSRVLDLYYPAPVPKFGPEVPSRFTLDWHVEKPGELVAGETRIDPTVAMNGREQF